MSKVNLSIIALVIIIFGAIFVFGGDDKANTEISTPTTELDTFAACIAESGAKLFGAWWCPHCEDQREMFGESEPFLPYVECSAPGSKAQNLVCKREDIQVYPSWKFGDDTKVEGLLSFAQLSERTNCPLPSSVEVEDEITPEVAVMPETQEDLPDSETTEEETEATSTEELSLQ